ncbi:MAG: M20/M25/M40 family metallo-hydrolase [Candidatus Lokiarchaeota archaeon]|nr:M20/M25/M40 family metallo-hydrolase [Candidatus Lokiarchaeota archaeon]
MEDKEKIVLQKIDEMKDELVTFLQQIIQIPSEIPPGKYRPISKFVATKMEEIGIANKTKRNNVIGEIGKEGGRTLIFNAHMDTVEVFDGWTKDPHSGEIIGNKIYGRGACDDKSCVAAEIIAAKALLDSGIELNGKLIITAVVNEEIGGIGGAEYITNDEIVKGDACLVGDGPRNYPIGYIGGTLQVSFTIKGVRRHNMAYPDLNPPNHNKYSGINAIHKMVPIVNFLMDLQIDLEKTETQYPIAPGMPSKVGSVTITKIDGGVSHTSVPDNCNLHCLINIIPEMDLEVIKAKILTFANNYKNENPGLDLTVQAPVFVEPLIANINTEFASSVKKAFKTLYNEERDFKMFIASTDAHHFKRMGIDTLVIGPMIGDNNYHAQDEFVNIEDLINTTKIFALTALDYLK